MIFDDEMNNDTSSNNNSNNSSFNFRDKMLEHLNAKECTLEDGSLVSNIDGICDMLIGKALNGDLQVISLINSMINQK